jgi:hypothetical protein
MTDRLVEAIESLRDADAAAFVRAWPSLLDDGSVDVPQVLMCAVGNSRLAAIAAIAERCSTRVAAAGAAAGAAGAAADAAASAAGEGRGECAYDASRETEDGWSPLSCSVAEDNGALAALLTHFPATVVNHCRPADGRTALMYAACYGMPHAAVALIKAGADVGLRDTSGRTARQLASEAGHDDVVAVLDAGVVA